MKIRTVLYRVWTYLWHQISAWNTTGEGIHSPCLFAIVRFILRDRNSYYCFTEIERCRRQLKACEDTVKVLDFGSQGTKEGTLITRRICDIADTHLESPQVAQALFRLLLFMHEDLKRPLCVLELGTSLGITTSYLASADSRNRLVTLEGSEALLKIAKSIWKTLKLENIEWQQGNIDDTLNIYARERWDLVFVDANHTYEATKRYVETLLPQMDEKGIIAIDDIYYSPDMTRAWRELQQDPRVTTSMDLYHVGILFVDPHYLKRHYKIRL